MAKIFLSFQNAITETVSDSVIPCFYESFIKGLLDAGNEVMVYHAYGIPYGNRPQESLNALSAAKKFEPDLIVAFNNYGPDYSRISDCPIVIYEVDSPLYYDWKDRIKSNPDRYKFICNQVECREVLRQNFGISDVNIGFAPFFSEVRAETVEKDVNISFVGSRFSGMACHWHQFCKNHADRADIRLYKKVAEELKVNPFCSVQELCNKYQNLTLTPDDIGFMISSLSAEKRVKVLSAIADLGLSIYGTEEWLYGRDCDLDLYLAYNAEKIYSLRHNQDLYNRSKVCVNVNHLQATSGFSWRVCDIMASSGCLVSEGTVNLKTYFPDVPIPTFTNRFECRKQCVRVLESPALQEDISLASQDAIDRNFRFKHVLPVIEESSGIKLSCLGRKGSLSFVERKNFDFKIKNGGGKKKSRLAFHCLKLALCQIPGLENVFNQEKLFRRIAGFTSGI